MPVSSFQRGKDFHGSIDRQERERRSAKPRRQEGSRRRSRAEHKASECWQGYLQAMEGVPSSSASSVAPSAATTPAAAKEAASFEEFNDEQDVNSA